LQAKPGAHWALEPQNVLQLRWVPQAKLAGQGAELVGTQAPAPLHALV
jgi:hypothetical protein